MGPGQHRLKVLTAILTAVVFLFWLESSIYSDVVERRVRGITSSGGDCSKLEHRNAFLSKSLEQCRLKIEGCIASKRAVLNDQELQVESISSESTCNFTALQSSVGQRQFFTVTARDLNGEELQVSNPFIWAAASGDQVYRVPIHISAVPGSPSRYEATFMLPVEGTYEIRVKHMSALICEHVLQVQGKARDRSTLPNCTVDNVGHGIWKTAKDWQPSHCVLPDIPPRSVAQGKRVLFLGDSLVRCFFWAYAQWLTGEVVSTHYKGYKKSMYEVKGSASEAYAKYQVNWMTNDFKLSVMDSRALLYLLKTNFANPLSEVYGYDTIVLGVGAHDLARYDGDNAFFDLEKNLYNIMHFLLNEMRYPGNVVWLSETPSVPERLNSGALAAYKTFQMESRVRRVNSIVQNVVGNQFGVPILDIFSLALCRPELSYDGQHYVKSSKPMDDPVYSTAVQVLANSFLAPRP